MVERNVALSLTLVDVGSIQLASGVLFLFDFIPDRPIMCKYANMK